jgi:hypothetical protein
MNGEIHAVIPGDILLPDEIVQGKSEISNRSRSEAMVGGIRLGAFGAEKYPYLLDIGLPQQVRDIVKLKGNGKTVGICKGAENHDYQDVEID